MWTSLFASKPVSRIKVGHVELPETFNYKEAQDIELIEGQIERFKLALSALQSTDKMIIYGAACATGCFAGSYIFPLTLVGYACSSVAAYYAAKRPEVFKEYRKALNDLIAVYNWSMAKGSDAYWYKLGVPAIQDLIQNLGPWVNSETICTWEDKDLEPGKIARRPEPSDEFKAHLKQLAMGTQTTNVWFNFYGHNGIESIPELLGKLKNGVTTLASNTFNNPRKSS